MEKFIFTYIPDLRERIMIRESELPMEEGLEISKKIWAEGGHDVYSEIVVNTLDKKFVCSMYPYEPFYHTADDYKYLEPALKEICEQYFLEKME